MPERKPCIFCGKLITHRGWRRHNNLHREEKKRMFRKKKKKYKKISIDDIPIERRVPQKVRWLVWKRDKGKCVYCRRKPRKKSLIRSAVVIQFGHYVAFAKGGDNCEKNIQLECKSCNLKKGIGLKKAGILNYRGVKGCTKRHERKSK